ncbi:amidohydrolase family protein [Pigmentiphaga kullae]|uniref:Putative TIM-barrel fold metal-dependent hydrolase n=1 Tax=Pigmentiphaga kullae TaxID=151784 RepID=A0A4Q7NF44_9BURK|nr:amidohydrolase family protein [Pigmentiphaga kullae]RZS81287.1 putative TIM-barrel fold metal-dependent hydrolase [Pigmentiphaga kullae]
MQACPGPDRDTRAPAFAVPPGSCDCHAHIFGPRDRFPFSPERSYTPEDCSADQYRDMLATLGFDRGVLVQGGAHGTDNAAMLDAMERLGPRIKGIAVLPPGTPLRQREALHARGVRGFRMSTVVSGGVGFDQLEALAAEAGEMGWHLLLHFHRSEELVAVADRLRGLRCHYVLDHLARIRADEGLDSPAFSTVMSLLDTDRCWIKLASLYRLSSQPYPHADMLPMIHRVVAARPDRMIWGSNWPHPIHTGPMPNDGDLVDLIPLWVPDAADRQRMLVDNPQALYGFEPLPRQT